jgi:hypothetical protein
MLPILYLESYLLMSFQVPGSTQLTCLDLAFLLRLNRYYDQNIIMHGIKQVNSRKGVTKCINREF